MDVKDKVGARTHVEYPTDNSSKDGRRGFVDMRDVLGGYQHVAEEYEREDGYGHGSFLLISEDKGMTNPAFNHLSRQGISLFRA